MTIRFVEEARQELLDAISHYEKIRVGLGARFKDELDRCVLWIADHAGLYRKRQVGYRRINLRVFPYYVPYIVRSETLGCWRLPTPAANRSIGISRQSQAGGAR